jgi:hypothetical protein
MTSAKVFCLHHDSTYTEQSGEWIVWFVRFHGVQLREDIFSATLEIIAFLAALKPYCGL